MPSVSAMGCTRRDLGSANAAAGADVLSRRNRQSPRRQLAQVGQRRQHLGSIACPDHPAGQAVAQIVRGPGLLAGAPGRPDELLKVREVIEVGGPQDVSGATGPQMEGQAGETVVIHRHVVGGLDPVTVQPPGSQLHPGAAGAHGRGGGVIGAKGAHLLPHAAAPGAVQLEGVVPGRGRWIRAAPPLTTTPWPGRGGPGTVRAGDASPHHTLETVATPRTRHERDIGVDEGGEVEEVVGPAPRHGAKATPEVRAPPLCRKGPGGDELQAPSSDRVA